MIQNGGLAFRSFDGQEYVGALIYNDQVPVPNHTNETVFDSIGYVSLLCTLGELRCPFMVQFEHPSAAIDNPHVMVYVPLPYIDDLRVTLDTNLSQYMRRASGGYGNVIPQSLVIVDSWVRSSAFNSSIPPGPWWKVKIPGFSSPSYCVPAWNVPRFLWHYQFPYLNSLPGIGLFGLLATTLRFDSINPTDLHRDIPQ